MKGGSIATFEVLYEPRDLWIGLYWTWQGEALHLYCCLLPCLPIHIIWQRH